MMYFFGKKAKHKMSPKDSTADDLYRHGFNSSLTCSLQAFRKSHASVTWGYVFTRRDTIHSLGNSSSEPS